MDRLVQQQERKRKKEERNKDGTLEELGKIRQ